MSRLIKSGWSNIEKQDSKVITIKRFGAEATEKMEEELKIPVVSKVDTEEIIQNAKREADNIIAEANKYHASILQEIEQMKIQWEDERQKLAYEAQQEGFQDGFENGRQQSYDQYQGLIEEARGVIESSKEDYFRKVESAEQTILALGLKVAEKILGEQLKENPEQFQAVVKNALREAKEYREIQLHVNPHQYGYLLSQKEELLKVFPREVELYIYPNSDLDENGCLIESDNGRIDASVDVQLEEIKQKLFELLESE